jgi:MRG-binding protein
MHKHFRMIALSEHLRNHGYDPTVEKHTRIPGIWEKLGTLYALPIIDDRENSFEYEDPGKFLEFKLPDEDYDERTFMKGKRRESSETPSSPPRLGRSPSPEVQGLRKRKRADTVTAKNRASTVDDTDETRTSPANSPPPKITRAGRSTNRSMGRVKAESSSRQQSKDTTVTEDEGAEETEEAGEDDEHEGEEEDGTPSPKTSKGASKVKADAPATRKSKRKR